MPWVASWLADASRANGRCSSSTTSTGKRKSTLLMPLHASEQEQPSPTMHGCSWWPPRAGGSGPCASRPGPLHPVAPRSNSGIDVVTGEIIGPHQQSREPTERVVMAFHELVNIGLIVG
jgi:hypothetical protein